MQKFDIAILGGGVAGVSAAVRATELGAKVCLIEEDRVGGFCVNRGLYLFKRIMSQLDSFSNSNGTAGDRRKSEKDSMPDIVELIKRAEETAGEISQKWQKNIIDRGGEIKFGRGMLINSNEILVSSSGEEFIVNGEKIILATGSRVSAPDTIPFDGERIIPIDEIMAIRQVPANILIVGAGAAGCEFANLFNRLGSRVFLCDEPPRLLQGQDPDVTEALEGAMKKLKIKLLLNKSVFSIYKDDEKIDITLGGGVKFSVNMILYAKNWKAKNDGVDAEKLGLRLGGDNEVLVDEKLESSLKGVYAAGSVTGRSPSESLSQEEGKIAAENALGRDRKLNADWVPQIVYTCPEIATVGCFADEAHHKGFRAIEGRCESQNLDYSFINEGMPGLFKIVVDRSSKKIIGAQIVSSRASEVIPMILLAIKKGLPVNSLALLSCGGSTQMQGVREAARDCIRGLQACSGKGVN